MPPPALMVSLLLLEKEAKSPVSPDDGSVDVLVSSLLSLESSESSEELEVEVVLPHEQRKIKIITRIYVLFTNT